MRSMRVKWGHGGSHVVKVGSWGVKEVFFNVLSWWSIGYISKNSKKKLRAKNHSKKAENQKHFFLKKWRHQACEATILKCLVINLMMNFFLSLEYPVQSSWLLLYSLIKPITVPTGWNYYGCFYLFNPLDLYVISFWWASWVVDRTHMNSFYIYFLLNLLTNIPKISFWGDQSELL